MLILRQKLQPHSELVYMCAVVLLCAIRSVGLGSKEASVLTAIALLAVLYKILLTDYTKKELIIGAILFGLLVYALVVNGDKMLLMTMVVIWGAKNTNIKQTLLWCLIVRVPLMFARILLAVTGVLPGSEEELLKTNLFIGFKETYVIRDYGFFHVNYLYFGLFSVGVLLILFLQYYLDRKIEKLLVIVLAILIYSVVLYFAYKLLHCRTGFYMWLVTLALTALMALAIRLRLQRFCGIIYSIVPASLMIGGIVLSYVCGKYNISFFNILNAMFSGRFKHFAAHIKTLPQMYLAQKPLEKIDNGFFYSIYNYGFLMAIILVFICAKAAIELENNREYYLVVMLIAVMGYMMGEAFPLSVAWNPILLLLSYGLFGESYIKNEKTSNTCANLSREAEGK